MKASYFRTSLLGTLTDEEYHSFGQLIQTDTVIYQGPPREVGVGFNVRFGR